MSDDQQEGPAPIEREAMELGWVPQDQFRGDPEKWVDANTFVERGRTVMPILRKTNEKLEKRLDMTAQELRRMKALYEASQEAISELQTVHAEATKQAVARAKAEVMREIREARDEGDVNKEFQLTEELSDIRAKEKELATPKPKVPAGGPPNSQEPHPDLQAWMEENPWFGQDQRKTALAVGIANELRANPEYDGLLGREFFDKIGEIMAERTEGPRRDKVSSGRPTGSSGGSVARGFADLPPEAKEACERQGRKLVGDGRAFKTMKDWQAYYAKLFYEGQ